MSTTVMWFRRDLRLSDNPALVAAVKAGDDVVGLILGTDPHLPATFGAPFLKFLFASMRDLDEHMDGHLVVRTGHPSTEIARVAKEVGATQVYVQEDFTPYGRKRDDEVERALAKIGCTLERVDSPYAVEPGAVMKSDETPYRVFTPFRTAWLSHGWGAPHPAPSNVKWKKLRSDGIPDDPKTDAELPEAGEKAAHRRLDHFFTEQVNDYADSRNTPSIDGTSRLSAYLRFGTLHPRQILKRLGGGKGADTYRSELCWRDFYADVLFHNPESRTKSLNENMSSMKVDEGKHADQRFEAWSQGLTGFPIVDAGMRQLLGEAWMHNRVRMIVASFLIKDLHIDWSRGADWFLQHLVDGDPASNTHGWQWVAGTGTDAAPYFRVFNPITQGKKFDPDGEYIKRWVPELRELDNKTVHEPWTAKDGLPNGYPPPMVDHAEERAEALRRYAATKE